jgi:hypothetical protein
MSGIVLLLFGSIVVILKGVIVKNLEDHTQSGRRREQLAKNYSMFQKMDKDGDDYISRKEFESGWSTTSSEDTNNTDYSHVSLVWNETWIDTSTGNPSTFAGKSSKETEKPLEREELCETRNLKNFPSRLLDKDDKGKNSKEEFEEGYELVQTFLDYEAGDDTVLCHLLHTKYKDGKNKQKANTSSYDLVVELRHDSVDAIPSGWSPVLSGGTQRVRSTLSPGTPPPSELPQASVTSKYDPETLNFGCSVVAAQGLRSAVGLDDDTVFSNFMKNPEVMIECEILITGLGGHASGCIDDIDNYYFVKFGVSGDWTEKEIIIDEEDGQTPVPDHVKASTLTGKYHGGNFKKEEYDNGPKTETRARSSKIFTMT